MAALNVNRRIIITPVELASPGFRHQRELLAQTAPARLDVATVEGRKGLWKVLTPQKREGYFVEAFPSKINCEDEFLYEDFGSYLFSDECKNGHKVPPDGFHRGLADFLSGRIMSVKVEYLCKSGWLSDEHQARLGRLLRSHYRDHWLVGITYLLHYGEFKKKGTWLYVPCLAFRTCADYIREFSKDDRKLITGSILACVCGRLHDEKYDADEGSNFMFGFEGCDSDEGLDDEMPLAHTEHDQTIHWDEDDDSVLYDSIHKKT
ncbi:MAG: hypothetical protein GY822_28725 [Deltaproteobacteria bacterium]|nr:hypothetical protein [Deltaproteobacteria bacterium]